MRRRGIGVVAAGIFACATVGARADDMKGMSMPSASSGGSDKAFAAAMDAMMKNMAVKTTGNPDRDFVDMMVPHHQGAIDMARVELRYGKDPALRKLASRIIAAQDSEIATMRAWKTKHAK